MNANELADELESTNNWMKDEGNWKNSTRVYSRVPFEAATMLRTQQAEIEALKAKQAEVLSEVKTSWTAISPVNGIPRESAHKLYEVLKDILK